MQCRLSGSPVHGFHLQLLALGDDDDHLAAVHAVCLAHLQASRQFHDRPCELASHLSKKKGNADRTIAGAYSRSEQPGLQAWLLWRLQCKADRHFCFQDCTWLRMRSTASKSRWLLPHVSTTICTKTATVIVALATGTWKHRIPKDGMRNMSRAITPYAEQSFARHGRVARTWSRS